MGKFCVVVRSADLAVVLFGSDWLLASPVKLSCSSFFAVSLVFCKFRLLAAPCCILRTRLVIQKFV